MKRLAFYLLILLGIFLISVSCGSTRKYNRSLESLMIQDNTKLRINREFYSRHNIQTRKDAYKKFRKYGRR